jgi:hypothetical protein
MNKISTVERDDAIRALKQDIKLKPGETVWTVLRHVSASGMSRTIDLFVIRKGRPRRISHLVARAVGYGFDRDRMGIKSQGGGMDMGFEAVYNLGYALWPKGVKSGYAGKPETDGGYALKQEWF